MRRWKPYCAFDVEWLEEEQAYFATCEAWPGNWALGLTPADAIADLKSVEDSRAEMTGSYRSCGCLYCDFECPHPGLRSQLTKRQTTRQIRFRSRMSM